MTKNKLTGYHGTTRANAQSILSSGKFCDSTKDNEWLGWGVYFFYYRDDAKWWTTANRYQGQETQILRGLLEYSDEQLADLDNPVELEKLNQFVEKAIQRQNEIGKPISAKIDDFHTRQCFACNLLRKFRPKIGIIIYTFPRGFYPGKVVFPGHAGFFFNQKQICVSDHSIITGIEEEQVNNHVRSQ